MFRYTCILIVAFAIAALAQDPCQQWPLTACIGNSVHFEKTTGQSAHFINVMEGAGLATINEQITVEMWMKPSFEQGRRNYIAGKWGPSRDVSDVWQIYYDTDGDIVFEVNNPDSELGDADNTIVRAPAAALNNTWFHLACVFNGQTSTAYIYINGQIAASATNASYPASRLKLVTNDIQIGRANEFSNSGSYRTFRGQIDEIRIWNRILQQAQIECEMNKSSYANLAQGLVVYYRCNEAPGIFQLCDASGNNNAGMLLANCQTGASDRPEYYPYKISSPQFPDTIKCVTEKEYKVTVTDTSVCGSRAYLFLDFEDAVHFTYPNQWVDLVPDIPTDFAFSFDSRYVGKVSPRIRIVRDNGCAYNIFYPVIDVVRITDLAYTVDTLDFGILKAFCVQKPYEEKTFRITNNTAQTGSNRTVRISGFQLSDPLHYQVMSPVGTTDLAIGQSVDVTVRFTSGTLPGLFRDTLRVLSDDACDGSGVIPLQGKVEQTLVLIESYTGDTIRADKIIDFGTICKDYPSSQFRFYWENISSGNITVTDVMVPEHFQFFTFFGPQVLEPLKSNTEKLIRFFPTAEGDFADSIMIIVNTGDCILRQPVYVKGRSVHPDIVFDVASEDFGDVIVGQELVRNISVTNRSDYTFTIDFALFVSEVFFFPGIRQLTLAPHETRSVPVVFRPTADSLYHDKLVFNQTGSPNCNANASIPLNGRGIYEAFVYEPEIMIIDKVVACGYGEGEITIRNVMDKSLLLNTFQLNDPSGNFTILEPVADIPSLASHSVTLGKDQSVTFRFRYTPNDIINDRADRAFLTYRADGRNWMVELNGNSVVPRLYVQDDILFGTVEVGETPVRTVKIENFTSLAIDLDSVTVPPGFSITAYSKPLPRKMMPGEDMTIDVMFTPAQAVDYAGKVRAYSSLPCYVEDEGDISGKGNIIPIEIINTLVSYGFVLPCNCKEIGISMNNRSKVNDAVIDDIWIDDGGGMNNARPEFFTWRTDMSPSGTTLPYTIPPRTIDTLRVLYCPSAPATRDSLSHQAMLHLTAHGEDFIWQLDKPFERYLVGKQTLYFEPTPLVSQFPPTLVDNFSVPRIIDISIPGVTVNPDRASVTVDSVTFEPDDRVFFASDLLGRSFPITIGADDTLKLEVNFKPRVYRDYAAKVRIHMSRPCLGIDTTTMVMGSGFATPFNLPFAFNSTENVIDTFRVISCDTLEIPVYSQREVPAEFIDIRCWISYDTAKFQYIGARTDYIPGCEPHDPAMNSAVSAISSREFLLKNFCKVDSLRPIFTALFKPLIDVPDTSRFTIDSLSFDSEEVILFRLIPDLDDAYAIIQRSDFEILDDIDFDSVRVLDCKTDTMRVQNTGDVPIAVNSLLNLPASVALISSLPPLGTTLQPAEIAEFVLEFCPGAKDSIKSEPDMLVLEPCELRDTNLVQGIGYTPLFGLLADLSDDFFNVDTIFARLGDTIAVPVHIDRDINAEYNGITYWVNGLSFDVNVIYNKYALKFKSAENLTSGVMDSDYRHGKIRLRFSGLDSVRAGQIATVYYQVVVPDTITSSFLTYADSFASDSPMFLDMYGDSLVTIYNSMGDCNLTYLDYDKSADPEAALFPNPGYGKLVIALGDKGPENIICEVYEAAGKLLLSRSIAKGQNGLYESDLTALSSGNYIVVIRFGNTNLVKNLVILK